MVNCHLIILFQFEVSCINEFWVSNLIRSKQGHSLVLWYKDRHTIKPPRSETSIVMSNPGDDHQPHVRAAAVKTGGFH